MPCAAMRTFLPDRMAGAMVLDQKGSTRSTVVLRDSVLGRTEGGRPA